MQITLTEATKIAQAAADKFCVAQTVYKTEETYGWTNTSALSNNLRGAQVAATWLPSNYFN